MKFNLDEEKLNRVVSQEKLGFSSEWHRKWLQAYRSVEPSLRPPIPVPDCTFCDIHKERHFAPVRPVGSLGSHYVVVGRNPGRQEGQMGEPFYPKAPGGGMLDKYLSWMQIGRSECHITNALFCYTQNDRAPSGLEALRCSKHKPIEFSLLTCPKFFFLLGNDAAKLFIGDHVESITKNYGIVYHVGKLIYLIPVFHPGSTLRDPNLMRVVSRQLTAVKEEFIDPFRTFLTKKPSVTEIKQWQL